MKTKFLRLTLAIFVIGSFCAKNSFAIDVAGSELSYQHLSADSFRFRYIYYKFCDGNPGPTTMDLHALSASCGISQTYTMTRVGGNEITNICPTVQTNCFGGAATGIQKWIYERDVVLNNHCSDWIFNVSKCCFNPSITTILNPTNYATYAEASLNNLTMVNSSPHFTNDPVISTCYNLDFHYNNGAFDPDGDSLAYMLSPVLTAGNTSAIYNPGYSMMQPLSSAPPVSIDGFTGDLLIHPLSIENGMMSYTVIEFRNGAQIGSVTRTVLMETVPCSNANPELTGMNGTSQQFVYVLPGTALCFDVFSSDPDTGQVLTLSWNQVIPAASFTVVGSPYPTGTFCWTPTLNDLRSQPYMFTATIADDNCPGLGIGVYSYFIYVTLDSSLVFAGTNDITTLPPLSIFPNPSGGVFTIQSKEKFSQLRIYNPLGECVLKKEFEKTFELSDQPPGIYYAEVITATGKVLVQKIIRE